MTNKIRDLDVKLDIISKLLDAIEKYPEERIGQIISNSLHKVSNCGILPDVFYIEDRIILDGLKRLK